MATDSAGRVTPGGAAPGHGPAGEGPEAGAGPTHDGRTLRFGEIEDSDVERVVALWDACGLTRPWNDPRLDIAQARTGATSTVLVARRGQDVVATVMTGVDGHRGWVYYLAVAPAEQGHGIGAAMLERGERWLAAAGARKVQLMVRDGNPAAEFYEARGYEVQRVAVLGRWLA
ncbi:GNAT family acetyltransferase [Georgenia daeguensis]|uniref:GNAT family acetyltransferase n=1 Tax=Georgenia daeguensis TaxID=908355 RepID=A0ABP8EUQ9_9MICO